MKVGLDLTVLELPCPTGVERAWRTLVMELATRRDAGRFVLYSRGPVDLGLPRSRRMQPVELGGSEPLSLWRERRLGKALAQDGVDLLHAPFAAMPMRTRVPRVVTIHELPWVRHPGCEGRGREMAHRVRVRLAASAAALLVVPSEATREDLVAEHPDAADRIRVVPHGIDPLFLSPPDEDGDRARCEALGLGGTRWFLASGGARPRKDLPGLMEAYGLYREAGGDRLLVLTGPGKPPPGPPPGVRALGWVGERDLLAVLRRSDALVYHSLNEGFGLPPLEAMAVGVPVVATAVGSVPEVCGEAALLVPPEDGEALAGALATVSRDDERRAALVAAGRERASAFTLRRAADGVIAVWREVVETARTTGPVPSSKEA